MLKVGGVMSYREKARAYFTAVNRYDAAAIERMVDENYIQHNPFVPTGRAAFLALIPRLRDAGSRIRNLRMIEDGRHVIMHHRWENAWPFGHERMEAFHIIRFDEKSKIVEHWNVVTDCISPDVSPTAMEDLEETEQNKICILEWFKSSLAEVNDEISYRKLHKIFGEGNFTLCVSEAVINNVPSAVYDLFRLEKGIIAEHWRIAQAIPTVNLANQNTMFGFR